MSQTIRVLLIENTSSLADHAARLLGQRAEVRLVGRVDYRHLNPHRVRSASPDVLLLDTGLPVGEDAAVIGRVRKEHADLPIVVLVTEDSAEAVVDYLAKGANGCVSRDAPSVVVLAALDRARRREVSYPNAIAPILFRKLREWSPEPVPPNSLLSPREKEVLGLLASGLLNKQIASRLRIALCTVKNHIHQIFAKLQVRRRRDAIQYAHRSGILGSSPEIARAGPSH